MDQASLPWMCMQCIDSGSAAITARRCASTLAGRHVAAPACYAAMRERDSALAHRVHADIGIACMQPRASASTSEAGARGRLGVHHQQARLEQVDVGGRGRARQAPGHARPAALHARRQLPLQVAVVLWCGGLGRGSTAPEATPHHAPAAAAPVLKKARLGSSCISNAHLHHSATHHNVFRPAHRLVLLTDSAVSGVRQRSGTADRHGRCRLA
jgi:hypothetical protein